MYMMIEQVISTFSWFLFHATSLMPVDILTQMETKKSLILSSREIVCDRYKFYHTYRQLKRGKYIYVPGEFQTKYG